MMHAANNVGNRFGSYKLLYVLHAVAIVLLVLTLVVIVFDLRIFGRQHNNNTISSNKCDTTTSKPPAKPTLVGDSKGFQDAAKILLANMNQRVDPCEDFYRFSCENYAINSPSENEKVFANTKLAVLDKFVENIEQISLNSTKTPPSRTELIAANVFNSCLYNDLQSSDHIEHARHKINELFGGFPAVDPKWKYNGTKDIFYSIALLENLDVSILFETNELPDQKNTTQDALYFYQFPMLIERNFYVKKKDLQSELNAYLNILIEYATAYAINSTVTQERIRQECQRLVDFETKLALATVLDNRNYSQQYNKYNQSLLEQRFPNFKWSSYFDGLGLASNSNVNFILTNPSYFVTLDKELKSFGDETLVNLAVIRFLVKYSEYLNENMRTLESSFDSISNQGRDSLRVHKEETLSSAAASSNSTMQKQQTNHLIRIKRSCAENLINYMPHAAAYIYMKDAVKRDEVKNDINVQIDLIIESFLKMVIPLPWITVKSLIAVRQKSENVVKNIGWPSWFNFTDNRTLDDYHVDYPNIKNESVYLKVIWQLSKAASKRDSNELSKTLFRNTFHLSAAIVEAGYVAELNAFTIPYGIFRPPYYRIDFPQYFNYAGHGGTAGHEISHAFDDKGVQFGPTGELPDCQENQCSWMDRNSTIGFSKMAQCVIQQYNSLCCPIKENPLLCANGTQTQGENIADIAGQHAAYRAYRTYVRKHLNRVEEARLPGLEKFTPNQLFWIAFAGTRCAKTTPDVLVRQLKSGSYAPSSCRVNQVVRSIPEFGADFGCKLNAPMYPARENRCAVWADN